MVCAVAPTVQTLIVARLFQGAAGALLTPGSLAMIEASFRRQDRPRAIGAWSGLTGVATAIGPLLGGYLVGAVSWRAVFLINVPLGVFVVFASRHVPESSDPTMSHHIDLRGVVLAALGLGGTTYALIEAPGHGMSSLTWVAAIGGVIALVLFVLAERSSPQPMLPLGLFSNRQFSAANMVTFVVYAALSGVFFLLVAFLQISMGYTPLAGRRGLAPDHRADAGAVRAVGRARPADRPSAPAHARTDHHRRRDAADDADRPGDSYLSTVFPAVVVFGAGLTLVVSPVTATVLAAADDRHSGIASGVNNAVARVAGLIAVAVLPLVAGLTGQRFYQKPAMTHGFHVAMVWTAVVAVGRWRGRVADDRQHVLSTEPESRGEQPVKVSTDYSCSVAGPPWRELPAPPVPSSSSSVSGSP